MVVCVKATTQATSVNQTIKNHTDLQRRRADAPRHRQPSAHCPLSHTLTHRTSRASWSLERVTNCNSPLVCHLRSAGKTEALL